MDILYSLPLVLWTTRFCGCLISLWRLVLFSFNVALGLPIHNQTSGKKLVPTGSNCIFCQMLVQVPSCTKELGFRCQSVKIEQ